MRFGGNSGQGPQGQRTGRREAPAERARPERPVVEPPPAASVTHEAEVIFDPEAGHQHSGLDSRRVNHSDLEPGSVTPDQHHAQVHVFADGAGLGPDHGVSGLTPGQVMTALTPTAAAFQALPAAPTHNVFSLTHGDTVAGAVVAGDLPFVNATPKLARLPIGATGRFLRVVAGLAAWATAAFSDLTGALGVGQHGALADGSHVVGGDLTGTTAAATVAKVQGKTFANPVSPADNEKYLHFNGTGLVWQMPTAGAPVGADYVTLSAQAGLSAEAVLGTSVNISGVGAPVASLAAGVLYWDATNLKLYRSSGAGVWVLVAVLSLLALALAGASDGQVLVSTGATTYQLEALTARISMSGAGSPNGAVAGLAGAWYLRTSDNSLWRCAGGTAWVGITSATGVTAHALLDGSVHTDTLAGSPVFGDLLFANATPKWARLPRGNPGEFLKVGLAGAPGWAILGFGDLTGTISNAQHGALSGASSHALVGDLSGTTAAAVVNGIRASNVPAPTAGDAGKALVFDGVGFAFVYRSVDVPITGWSRINLSTAPTADGLCKRVASGGVNVDAPFIPHRSGYLVGLSFATETGGSVGSGTYTVTAYKNGAATGVTLAVSGTHKGSSTHAGIAFAAGDELQLYDKRTGTLASEDVQLTLFVVWTS